MEHSDPIPSSTPRTPPRAEGVASPLAPAPSVAFLSFLESSRAEPARTPGADATIAPQPKPAMPALAKPASAQPPRGTRFQDRPAPISTPGIDGAATPADVPIPTAAQTPPPQGGAALAAVPFRKPDDAAGAGIVAARPNPSSTSAVPGQPDSMPETAESVGARAVAAQDTIPPLAPDPLAPLSPMQIALPARGPLSSGDMASPIAGIDANARPEGGLTPPFHKADDATGAITMSARLKPLSTGAVPGQPDDTPEPAELPGPRAVAAQGTVPPLGPDPFAPPPPGGMASPMAGIRAIARPQGGIAPAPPLSFEGEPRETGAAPAIPATASPAMPPILERPSAVPSIRVTQPASAVTKQVMPAMLSVASGAAGPVLTLHLNPGELGAIRVTLERDTGGGAGVTLAVERPETLRLLRNDMAHLHAALDMAGVSQAGRTLSLHIQAPDAPPPFLGGNPGQDTSGAPAGADGGHRGGGRHSTGAPRQASAPADADTLPGDAPRRATWLRAGIDITA